MIPNTSSIGTTMDIDTITRSGWHPCTTTNPNWPFANQSGFLIIFAATGHHAQIALINNANFPNAKIRWKYGYDASWQQTWVDLNK